MLERTIEADRLYVMDRGYAKFALFNRIVGKDSSYACRLRDNNAYEVLEERPLTQADRAAPHNNPGVGFAKMRKHRAEQYWDAPLCWCIDNQRAGK